MKKYIITISILLLALFAAFIYQLKNTESKNIEEAVLNTQETETVQKTEEPTNENDNQNGVGDNPISPTPTPTPALPSGNNDDSLTAFINQMSLRDKICQMLIVTPESIVTGYSAVTKAGDVMKAAIEKYPVGGVIYFDRNIESASQLQQMIKNTQIYTKIPMFISTDQEGGNVARLNKNVGCTEFNSMYSYRGEGKGKAFENAATIGKEMKALGFNLDFAPVADVWSNKKNTVIGERAYSDNFTECATLVSQAVAGFHSSGMMCSLKHFPGHGDTSADTHNSSAHVTKTKAQLNSEEMLPFKAGIAADADMVMIGHLIVDDIDKDFPATISSKVVNDYLRKEIGFGGVVITDSLAMGAVTNKYTGKEVAVMAVKAGVDILLMPNDVSATIEALENAVKNGEIPESRINESVERILKLKKKYNLF